LSLSSSTCIWANALKLEFKLSSEWTLNAGVRWDHYQLVANESAISPRVSLAWSWPERDLVLRGSYDRAFQTPAVENLLLASSPAVDAVSDAVLRLPVQPSLGNFYEVGATKAISHLVRVDASFAVDFAAGRVRPSLTMDVRSARSNVESPELDHSGDYNRKRCDCTRPFPSHASKI